MKMIKVPRLNPTHQWLKNSDPTAPISRTALRNIELVQCINLNNLTLEKQVHCFPEDVYESAHRNRRGTATFEASCRNYVGPERGLTEDLWTLRDEPIDEELMNKKREIIYPEFPPFSDNICNDLRTFKNAAITKWVMNSIKLGTDGTPACLAKRSGKVKEKFDYDFDKKDRQSQPQYNQDDDDEEVKDNNDESDDDDDVDQDIEMVISGVEQVD